MTFKDIFRCAWPMEKGLGVGSARASGADRSGEGDFSLFRSAGTAPRQHALEMSGRSSHRAEQEPRYQ